MRTTRGFTLFELLIVMAIIGIVTAFALPGLRELLANSRVRATASDIETAIAFAKSTAATTRQSVVITTTATGYQVRRSTSPVSLTGTIIQSYGLGSTAAVTTVIKGTSTAVSNFQFTPTGFLQQVAPPAVPSAVALTIHVCDAASKAERGRTLDITTRGRILVRRDSSAANC